MRALPTLLLLVASCTWGEAPVPDPVPSEAAAVDLEPLRAAVQAWRADPSQDRLQELSVVAGALTDTPVGDTEVDAVLGDALCNALLRPDLGLARLQAHAPVWTAQTADPWLSCLLRSGEGERLAVAVKRLHGRPLDPTVDGFRAAMVQSRGHASVGWREALRAHDAGALADAQHPRGRRLDRPVPDLGLGLQVFAAAHPDQRVHAVVTRSARSERDDPLRDAGVIPVMGGNRRVLGYAAAREGLGALAEQVAADPPVRVVGLAAEAVDAQGHVSERLCAEGRYEAAQLWLLTACEPARELAWIEATEHAADRLASGEERAQAVQAGAERYRAAVDAL